MRLDDAAVYRLGSEVSAVVRSEDAENEREARDGKEVKMRRRSNVCSHRVAVIGHRRGAAWSDVTKSFDFLTLHVEPASLAQ